jgi:hypothetical protein
MIKHYTGDIQPLDGVIFVFGSNPEGRHGLGSAKVAKDKFGAVYGVGEGLMGNSYALPTKDLRIKGYRTISKEDIVENIKRMYECARENNNKKFMIAYRNKEKEYTLNGYYGWEMMQMFIDAGPIPENVYVSEEWFLSGKFN